MDRPTRIDIRRIGRAAQLRCYGWTTAGVIAATLIELLFIEVFVRVPLFLYWPIVILTGWFCGLGPGLYAALLSMVLANRFIFPRRYTLTGQIVDLTLLLMFAAITFFMNWLRQREHRAQAIISQQKLEMQITLSSIGDGVIVTDLQGHITFINPVAAALTGWSPAEAVGRHIAEVFRTAHESTRQPIPIPALRAIAQGIVTSLEEHTLLLSRTGEERPISDSGAPIRDASGEIVGAVLVFRDISEERDRQRALEASEARYRHLVNNATDIIYTLDLEGSITSMNPVAEQITGYSLAELQSMSLTDLVVPEDVPGSSRMLDRKLSGETEKTVYELDIMTKDRQRRTLEINSRLTGGSQAPTGVEGIARDITLRKAAERRIVALHEISAALTKASSLRDVASVIMDRVLSALGAHHGAVALVSADGQALDLLLLTNLTQEDFEHYRRTPLDVPGPMTDAVRNNAPVWLESQAEYLERYPRYADVVKNVTKTQVSAALPLRIRSQVIGSLVISFPDARQLSTEDREFLETIADYCAQSIERAQLFERERQAREILQIRVRQQSTIAEIGQRALTDPDLSALMEAAVRMVASTLDVEYVKVMEHREDDHCLLLKAGVGWQEGLVGRATVSDGPESQAGYTLAASAPVIVEDLRAETRFSGPSLLLEHGVVSGMSVIIHGYRKPYGVFGIHTREKRAFTQDDIYFIQSIASILGAAVERRRLDTVLEEQRRWLTDLIDTAPGIIWENQYTAVDEAPKLVFISAYVETMLGYSVEEALSAPNFWLMILHPEDAPETAAALYRAGQAHSSGVVNFRVVHRDGHVIDVQALMTTIFEGDKPVGRRGVMMDVSERQQLIKVQARYAEMLRRSNEELQQFAYIASHDLQAPLRQVRSYLQLLEERYMDRLDEDARDFIRFAVDSAAHMSELIKGLLSYSRIDIEEQAFEEIDAQAALNKALDNLLLLIEECGARITHDPLPRIRADQLQLTQLFQNLISNAITYRRTEPPQIHIGAERRSHEWRFCVSDNGIGIEPDALERIFVIFGRLHTKEEYPGTGIGLAICKKVVERHGGRIWVDSVPGRGTTFYFTIPA